MSSAACPVCEKEVKFFKAPAAGDKKLCLGCSNRLEVVNADPIELKVSDEAPTVAASGGGSGISDDY